MEKETGRTFPSLFMNERKLLNIMSEEELNDGKIICSWMKTVDYMVKSIKTKGKGCPLFG